MAVWKDRDTLARELEQLEADTRWRHDWHKRLGRGEQTEGQFYEQIQREQRMLKNEGTEHSEAQAQVIELQAEVVKRIADAQLLQERNRELGERVKQLETQIARSLNR